MEEAIMCLETELGRPVSERKTIRPPLSRGVSSSTDTDDMLGASNSIVIGDGSATASEIPTPLVMHGTDGQGREINLEEMDFSGRPRVVREESTDSVPSVLRESYGGMPIKGASRQAGEGKLPPVQNTRTSGNQQTLAEVINEDVDEDGDVIKEGKTKRSRKLRFGGRKSKAEKEEKKRLKQALHQDSEDSSSPEPSPSPSSSSNVDDASGTLEGSSSGAPTAPSNVERIINVKNCPMCHRPRMKSKAEMDIITHMAICASQDWGSVDKIMVGNFVTASQAQRKWYTKVLSKVSSGNYKLGAVRPCLSCHLHMKRGG
jgi:phosphatidylserine decarboxylase